MEFDVIIVGSGHAGIEAAAASARLGCRTLLLTQNLDTIGQMSCNPAIGGLGKGQIVREIDALGGMMAQNTDATGIQFRMLNRTKGPSVRAPRAQCDKKAYQFRLKAELERMENLTILQTSVTAINTDGGSVTGVSTDLQVDFAAEAVVVTAGTFLRALVHLGQFTTVGGRMADKSSRLSEALIDLGFVSARFKTGTPCRLNCRSINFSDLEKQLGDEPPPRFSFVDLPLGSAEDTFTLNRAPFHVEQSPCWITHTTTRTRDIICANLHLSALYSGRIEGTGPRYCPSIEDKIVKFADKESHQVFLEPEGRHTNEFYVNGISTSLPFVVQEEFVRSIVGLEQAEIMRPGYAVEYDYFPPTQLLSTLETKLVSGLYFAGQVNGTSGYEEAAGQGLVAGANAALKVQNRQPLDMNRAQSYIGVMIDDLVTQGTDEPYRMFTSRAEERLSLRQDNADQRLTPLGRKHGLIPEERWKVFSAKLAFLEMARSGLAEARLAGKPLTQHLKRPDFTASDIPPDLRKSLPMEIWELAETEIKYEGYVRRQSAQSRRTSQRNQRIPDGFDFDRVTGLRKESREKLRKSRPTSMLQVLRDPGITAADASIISIWLMKNGLRTKNEADRASVSVPNPQ